MIREKVAVITGGSSGIGKSTALALYDKGFKIYTVSRRPVDWKNQEMFHIQGDTRKFSYYNARRQGIEITPEYVQFIEEWAKITLIVPPRMSLYIEKNIEIQRIFQDYAS